MNKYIKELVKLSTENPFMEIITMVDTDVVAGDEYGYWLGEISKIKIENVYQPDEIVFCDTSDIEDYISEKLEEDMGYDGEKLDEEVEKEFNRLVLGKEIRKKIIIYIGV